MDKCPIQIGQKTSQMPSKCSFPLLFPQWLHFHLAFVRTAAQSMCCQIGPINNVFGRWWQRGKQQCPEVSPPPPQTKVSARAHFSLQIFAALFIFPSAYFVPFPFPPCSVYRTTLSRLLPTGDSTTSTQIGWKSGGKRVEWNGMDGKEGRTPPPTNPCTPFPQMGEILPFIPSHFHPKMGVGCAFYTPQIPN